MQILATVIGYCFVVVWFLPFIDYKALMLKIKALLRFLGFGYLIYHSDSQKTFHSFTIRGAIEWAHATYADSSIFSNATKNVVGISYAGALAVEWA